MRSCDFEPDLPSDGYFDILTNLAMSCICNQLPTLVLLHRSLCKALVALQRSARKVQNSEDSLKLLKAIHAPSNARLMHQISKPAIRSALTRFDRNTETLGPLSSALAPADLNQVGLRCIVLRKNALFPDLKKLPRLQSRREPRAATSLAGLILNRR